jgi:hypothetical protein
MYKWELKGDILAYYLQLYRFDHLNWDSHKKLASQLGTTVSSLKARMQNVRNCLNPEEGLSNSSKQTQNVVQWLESIRINSVEEELFQQDLAIFLNNIL